MYVLITAVFLHKVSGCEQLFDYLTSAYFHIQPKQIPTWTKASHPTGMKQEWKQTENANSAAIKANKHS